MPNTDQNTGSTPVASNQNPATDEFDLGMLSQDNSSSNETSDSSIETAPTVSEETPVITTNSSLDFNLDLPDSYAEDPNSNQSENKTEEPAAAPVVDSVAPDTSAENNSEAKAEESWIPSIILPEASTESVSETPVVAENLEKAPEVNFEANNDQTSTAEPVSTENSWWMFASTESVSDSGQNGWALFSSTQASDETFVPDTTDSSTSNSTALFWETPVDANLNSQPSADINLDETAPSFRVQPQNWESLSDTLKFQEEVEIPSESTSTLDTSNTDQEATSTPNPLLEEPTLEEESTLNMDTLMNEESTVDISSLESSPLQETSQENVENWVANEQPVQDNSSTWTVDLNTMLNQPTDQVIPATTETSEQTATPSDAVGTPVSEAAPEQNAEIDPFLAMKQTLEWKNNTWFQATDKPTLDLNNIPSQPQWTNPLKSGFLSKLKGISLGWGSSSKKSLVPVLSILGIVVAWALVFIRYPDLFTGLISSQNPQPVVLPSDPVEPEHPSAGNLTGESTGDVQEPIIEPGTTTWDDQEIVEVIEPSPTEVPVDENIINWGDDDIQVIDLTSDSDPVVQNEQFPSTPSVPEEPSIPETPNNPTEDPSTNPEAVNPLEAVEGLVGPINNNDLVAQEIMQYQELGASLKDQWAAANNKKMHRYGTVLEKSAKDLIQQLENGENIDISTWMEKKATFDDYVEKANA